MAWVTTATGIAIPEPAYGSGTMTLSTLVNAGRNAKGNFVGQVIGDDKMKVEMNWEVLTNDQFSTILNVFDHDYNANYKFTQDFVVYDPRLKAYVTKEMYVGDRSGTPVMVTSPGTGHPRYWTGVKVDLIEV